MPWICPEGGCHVTEDTFDVRRQETRTDTIVHWFEPGDEHLENPKSEKIYCGDESTWQEPICDICESDVVWIEPKPKGAEDADTDVG